MKFIRFLLKDINPIEQVWNDLKYFLSHNYKPNSKIELINGIKYFWANFVTLDYCNSKIDHINRILKKIIALKGTASGF
jgi:hypothetical protein